MTRLNTQFSVKGISLLNSVMASSSSVQFSSKSFCSIKSTILLEMKYPQLSKPEATAARNQNSIGDRTEKKNLGRNQAQSGGHFSSARRHIRPNPVPQDIQGQFSPLYPSLIHPLIQAPYSLPHSAHWLAAPSPHQHQSMYAP